MTGCSLDSQVSSHPMILILSEVSILTEQAQTFEARRLHCSQNTVLQAYDPLTLTTLLKEKFLWVKCPLLSPNQRHQSTEDKM